MPNPQAAYGRVQRLVLTGELPLAQTAARKARDQFGNHSPEWSWKFRLLEARTLVLRGRSDDVLLLLSDPLPPALASGDLAIQWSMNRAMAWSRLGRPAPAIRALDDAQRLVDQSQSSLRGELLSTRGVVDVERGDLDRAESMFRQGLEFAREQNDQYLQASIQLNIGVVALRQEHYDEALYWCHAASELARTIDANLILEKALANEGRAYYDLGDFERSLVNSQQAAVQAEKLGSAFDQVTWLNNAGLAMFELHDYKAAETYYKKSLAIAEATQNRTQIIDAHVALAFQLLQRGQDDQARIHIDQSLDSARSGGNTTAELEPLFLKAILATRQSRWGDAEAILKSIYVSPSLTPSFRWGVEDAFANLYANQINPQQAEEWYLRSIETFERQRSSLRVEENRLPFFGNANELYLDYVEFLINAGRTDQALRVLDAGRARTLQEGLGIGSRSDSAAAGHPWKISKSASPRTEPRAIARAVGGTVLEYLLGAKRSYLWAITPTAVHLFELPGQADIDHEVEAYQRDIASSSDVLAKRADAGRWLYDKLVAPAQSMMPEHSKVFLIPDASLNRVNFETFLAPSPALHYWLEDVTLTTADSLRMLQTFHSHTVHTTAAKLLLIGNPISPADEFADLPNASAEVASVSSHFPATSRKVLTRLEASPEAYKASHPGQFNYIHFVAHGVASQLSPLDSAVLLSRTSERPDDFKLYARDIVHLPLHAELVTISTCYGSGIKSYAGEGLVGLSWAFLRAGSHNVIGAMWAVSDASTPLLMDHLYSSLEQGSEPDVALRAAKLALAHSKGVYRKPLYWGAFQLYAGS